MDPFLDWLIQRGGLDGGAYRPAAIQRRLPACLRQLRVASPRAARELLERRPELVSGALSAVLIGVSDFFRDEAVFEVLRGEVLPELVRERVEVRVCSVGCSAGQELYSVAMLLAEFGALERGDLLGVDCRADAVARATAGRFARHEMADVEPQRMERFFHAADGGGTLRAELRARTRWQVADVLTFDPGASWDLILFRNVAIYLEETRLEGVWARLVSRLAPGACLVTGRAEQPPSGLPLRRVAPCVYRCVP